MDKLKISVVTVCYNMASYIEQTIKSILNQEYPNLEYIVIDGGSTDGTQSIIEKYKSSLAYYVSEPDNGMYDAINKGFSHATGDVVAWLNADDIYMPWTFNMVNRIFSAYSDINWIGGKSAFLTEDGVLAQVFPKSAIKTQKDIENGWCRMDVLGPLLQEGMFWRKSLMDQAGPLNTTYKYAGDFELWTRFAQYSNLVAIDIPLAAFRRRNEGLSIGQRNKYNDEVNNAISSKPKYPNILWRIGHKYTIIKQLLRLLRLRKNDVIFYKTSNKLYRSHFWGSSSTQCIESLRLYMSGL